jgi:hypothetical protein
MSNNKVYLFNQKSVISQTYKVIAETEAEARKLAATGHGRSALETTKAGKLELVQAIPATLEVVDVEFLEWRRVAVVLRDVVEW